VTASAVPLGVIHSESTTEVASETGPDELRDTFSVLRGKTNERRSVTELYRCLKVEVHEKTDLPEDFHKRRTREFGGESAGALPVPRKK